MADEPKNEAKPFPTAKSGASDDDIFAEMGRMLAQDQVNAPKKTAPAAAPPPAAAKPAAASGAPSDVLELTQVVKPGKPQPAAKPAAAPAAQAPVPAPAQAPAQAPAPAAAPAAATTVSQAAAMLDKKPAAATAATVSNRSLDAIVEDVARGMIQEWLDKNMERIAREEAAKVAPKT